MQEHRLPPFLIPEAQLSIAKDENTGQYHTDYTKPKSALCVNASLISKIQSNCIQHHPYREKQCSYTKDKISDAVPVIELRTKPRYYSKSPNIKEMPTQQAT